MDKRVYIRIDDDGQLDDIQRIAGELSRIGLAVLEVSPIVGQITGTMDPAMLQTLEQKVNAMGLRLVHEEADSMHRLPPEGSDLQ